MIRKLFFVLTGYLNGSMLYGEYITKLIKGKDIMKESKDGNPGTANAFMVGGFLSGFLTLICDLLKGFFQSMHFIICFRIPICSRLL